MFVFVRCVFQLIFSIYSIEIEFLNQVMDQIVLIDIASDFVDVVIIISGLSFLVVPLI